MLLSPRLTTSTSAGSEIRTINECDLRDLYFCSGANVGAQTRATDGEQTETMNDGAQTEKVNDGYHTEKVNDSAQTEKVNNRAQTENIYIYMCVCVCVCVCYIREI